MLGEPTDWQQASITTRTGDASTISGFAPLHEQASLNGFVQVEKTAASKKPPSLQDRDFLVCFAVSRSL
jgi:hypothetical protein